MLKKLKFPLIYLAELLLWLPIIAGFYTTISFVAAKSIASLDLQGKSLPTTWEAAVHNHGSFLQGYLIANHPIAFALGILSLFGPAIPLYFVHKAQVWQRQEAKTASASAHTIAHLCVVALLAAIGYFVISHVLVGVSAA
jgi:hypothetical protein